jgi:hypothetical protein
MLHVAFSKEYGALLWNSLLGVLRQALKEFEAEALAEEVSFHAKEPATRRLKKITESFESLVEELRHCRVNLQVLKQNPETAKHENYVVVSEHRLGEMLSDLARKLRTWSNYQREGKLGSVVAGHRS